MGIKLSPIMETTIETIKRTFVVARAVYNIIWSIFRHPTSTTTISGTTGKVIKNE